MSVDPPSGGRTTPGKIDRGTVVRETAIAGARFAAIGVLFVLVSTLTSLDRSIWIVLNQVKGVLCFGCCALAGLRAARRTDRLGPSSLCGGLAAVLGASLYGTALFVVPYAFLDLLRQYPFEHHSFLHSGASSLRAYLLSEKGFSTVRSTSVGLLPIVLPVAATLGAGAGALGGVLGKRRNRRVERISARAEGSASH